MSEKRMTKRLGDNQAKVKHKREHINWLMQGLSHALQMTWIQMDRLIVRLRPFVHLWYGRCDSQSAASLSANFLTALHIFLVASGLFGLDASLWKLCHSARKFVGLMKMS